MSAIDFLPWSWTITPSKSSKTTCPSSTSILGTFAAVNFVTTAMSYFLGDFHIVRRITCGLLGKPTGKPWLYMWAVNLGLQLISNVAIATIIKNVPGYTDKFHIGQVVLLYATRPRFSWILLGLLEQRTVNLTPWTQPYGLGRRHAKDYLYPWRAAFLSCMISEILHQLIAFYTIGLSAHFAASRGYYVVNSDAYRSLPEPAHWMYAGALFYLIAGSATLIVTGGYLFLDIQTEDPTHDLDEEPAWLILVSFLLLTI